MTLRSFDCCADTLILTAFIGSQTIIDKNQPPYAVNMMKVRFANILHLQASKRPCAFAFLGYRKLSAFWGGEGLPSISTRIAIKSCFLTFLIVDHQLSFMPN
jgi:hypothetical protein